ncbi:LysR family transcriptional regulator [Herbaspirillum sp.]|uniref:LysR family transcriptional regulator n=1 Tax=Herbaspirillum sp. TaxID=1890675 RepID=UPI001B2D817E|nr:LysR family transcriptional regulator [Herbaspirillum sp.]MBO9535198.1 LysR family transcriptional regulator [Herbaspirillum sp.]
MDLLDPKLLQLFDLLYRTRSVTRSADELGLAQPTVSIWLRLLRDHFHDQLFVRTPSGMQPTPAADALIGPARQILESLRRLANWEAAFDPATATRQFRICMTDASHITLLPRLLEQVRICAPGVGLKALRMDGVTAEALETGEADLAVGYAPWLESGIYQQTLYSQDWVCLASATHPRIGRQLQVDDYQRESHIVISAGTGYQLLESALHQQQIQRTVLLELPGFLGLGAIISNTDLIATLPRHIGETLAALNQLKVFTCPVSVPGFEVKQHWHARYHHDPANRWLRQLLAELFMGKKKGKRER